MTRRVFSSVLIHVALVAAVMCPSVCLAQAKAKAAPKAGKAPAAKPLIPKAPPIPKEKLEKPNVTIVLRSSKEFFDDIKFIFNLAKSPKQYETLTSTFDLYLAGVDRTQVISIRGYVVGNTMSYVAALPVKSQKDLKLFLETASDIDVKNKPEPGHKDVHKLFSLVDGYLRYDAELKYAIIGENLQDVLNIKSVPSDKLLKGYDLALHIDNDAESLPDRKKAYDKLREEALAGLKKQGKEDEGEFKFRKMIAEQQLDELERFFVEAEHITLGWTTSVQKKSAMMNIELTALPKTSLEESVQLLGKTPDAFAGIESKGAAVTGSINFAIDSMRKAHMLEGVKIGRPRRAGKIAANPKFNEEQKKTETDLANLLFDIMEGLTKIEVFNGFIRVFPGKAGVFTTVGGLRIEDGQKVVEIIKKHGKQVGEDKVKLNADKEGDVAIHAILVPEEQKLYPELIADDGTIYIGTSKNAVWYALGDDALATLKKVIGQAKEAQVAGAPLAEFYGHIGPWVPIIDRRLGAKRDPELSKIAQEVFKPLKNVLEGTETMTIKLERAGDAVHVYHQFDEDLLRFAGKVMADFVKKALE